MHAMHFFRIVPLHSTYMVVGLAVLAVFGGAMLVMDPGRGMDATVPMLLLQMFAVSSGFAVPARRGHFDLLLTGGASRFSVALAHWTMSVVPGMFAWLCLGCVEWVVAGRPGTAFSNGTIAALLLISTIGWAITVPLPRLSGGVIWLVVFFAALATTGNWQDTLLRAAEGGAGNLQLSVVFLVCPLLLVGTRLDHAQILGVLPGLVLGTMAVAVAVAWIQRADIALEAAQ